MLGLYYKYNHNTNGQDSILGEHNTNGQDSILGEQCSEIEDNLNKNHNKRAFQVVKDVMREKKGRINTIQDKSGECLTEEREVINGWTEYCTELCNSQTKGNSAVLDYPMNTEDDNFPILCEEVEAAFKSLKKGNKLGEKL